MLKNVFLKPSSAKDIILIGFVGIVGYWALTYFIGGPLSIARIYIVAFILLAIMVSYGLLKLQETKYPKLGNVFAMSFLILFVLASVLQFPSYIVGDTSPMRGNELIDGVYYWDTDIPQYAVANFTNITSNSSIRTDIMIRNYYLLELSNSSNNRLMEKLNTTDNVAFNLESSNFVLLHDKFRNNNFTYREYFPNSSDYDVFNQVYSNGDYKLYLFL